MRKPTPFLWFDDQAEDAANYYVSIFPNSKITDVSRYREAGPRPAGMVMTVSFDVNGQDFIALNGGPQYTFDEAVSFMVNCETQAEVDTLWDRILADGGDAIACGWIKDKFGLCWQVVPEELFELLSADDREAAQRAMTAMMDMVKLDVNALRAAFDGKSVPA
ncbi:MAG: VOC family protein [Candidatus Eremiobacteraeota bacterium]|nr:VOC family protein [Candidatus Eremiobacteraeota bacterium]